MAGTRASALAAVLMLVGLITYLLGQRHLPDGKSPRVRHTTALPPLTPAEKRRTWALIGLIALTILPSIAYPMIWNIGILWIDQHVALGTPVGAVPASWFNSVDAFASIVVAAPLVALWAWQARRGTEPGSLAKIGIGSAIIGVSACCLRPEASAIPAAARFRFSGPWRASSAWARRSCGIGRLRSRWCRRRRPAKVNSTLMGGPFLALFVGSVAMGWVGSFYDQMSPAAFWTLDAGSALRGAHHLRCARTDLSRLLEGDP